MNSLERDLPPDEDVPPRRWTATADPGGHREAERRRRGWLAAASAATRALTEEDGDVRGRLDVVAETLRVLEDADVVVLFVDTGAGLDEVCSADGPGLPPGTLLDTRAPSPPPAGEGPRDVPAQRLGWVAERVVLVPARPVGGPVAVLALGWVDRPGPLDGVDGGLAGGFLARVCEAVGLAGRIDARVRRAVSRDRDRIARDLHDHVIQRLFAVGMSLQGASVSGAADDAVEAAVDSLDETIRDVRRAIFALQERHPDPDGRADLDSLVGTAAAALGFLPVLTVRGALSSVPAPVRREVMAVVREALSNVVRHARATHVAVDLTVADRSTVVLTVTDDGRGGPATPPGPGLGVGNVVRRARDLGGWATVGRGPAGGTQVRWSVPLPAVRPPPPVVDGVGGRGGEGTFAPVPGTDDG